AAGTVLARARAFIAALGGSDNLDVVNACTTRLRLTVKSQETVDPAALKRLGAIGIVRTSADGLQVIVGPTAELLAGEMREALASLPGGQRIHASSAKAEVPQLEVSPAPRPQAVALSKPIVEKLLAALGGAANVRTVEPADSRLRIAVADAGGVDHEALRRI
ncbi:PTS system, N-acetylglucosamine-specific IIBC subunit, partial [mine drainage metagenome]